METIAQYVNGIADETTYEKMLCDLHQWGADLDFNWREPEGAVPDENAVYAAWFEKRCQIEEETETHGDAMTEDHNQDR